MSISPPTVEQLYECAQTLSDSPKNKISEHEDEYRTILSGVKGDAQAKRLASQFIARFFSNFPNLANESQDAIIDLCEDDDVNIRKQAIKDLPTLCRDMKEFLPKIADILSQLLQTDDITEVVVVQNSLMTLFRKDAKGTLIGLFSQIKTGGEEVRDRAIKFLHLKIKTNSSDLLNTEAEAVLLEQISSIVEDCTPDEFHMFMSMLALTRLPKMVTGQSKIVELITKTADLGKPFNAHSEEDVCKLIQCTQAALPFFSSQVRSTAFVDHFCRQVFPVYDLIEGDDSRAQIVKLLAEVCLYTGDLPDPQTASKIVHEKLLEHLPPSPEVVDSGEISDAKFEFTKVECLLFAFHTIARQDQKFLNENPEVFKEFKSRLQFFALAIQGYIRKLKEFVAGKSKSELASEENQLKLIALRSVNNINALIKDLFHIPPSFKTKIVLSWKHESEAAAGALKRKSISFQDSNAGSKVSKTGGAGKTVSAPAGKHYSGAPRKGQTSLYAPPQGKYSKNVGQFAEDGSTGGARGGRNRGGGRGGRYNGGRRF